MNNQYTPEGVSLPPEITPVILIERHLHEWLQLQDYLRDAHAPIDQQTYCRSQVTRLQLDLFRLRST